MACPRSLSLGDVDVEVADRISLELPLRLLVARQLWQAADAMAVQAEIKTGRRRIIQYLLSPISQALREAGREK